MEEELKGSRVLIVENERAIALVLTEIIELSGGVVIGPAYSLEDAFNIMENHQFDCAVLDIQLKGTTVYPLADELNENQIPFCFFSGMGELVLPARFKENYFFEKPASLTELINCLALISHSSDHLS